MNPLLQLLNQNSQIPNQTDRLSDAISLIDKLRGSSNPQEAVIAMIQNTPQGQQIMELLKSGKTPKALALDMMQERGIDPSAVLSKIYKG